MTAIRYTGEENLTRIKMQKNIKFILVEGEDDIPIYENILHSHFWESEGDVDFEVIHGGGKSKIIPFAMDCDKRNFISILDLDFDYRDKITDNRIIYLTAYSIENYYFHRVVISYLIANLIKLTMKEVLRTIDLKAWHDHVDSECTECLKHIYYYQKNFNSDKEKWSSLFICNQNGDWKIDTEKINRVLDKVKSDTGATQEQIDAYFNETFPRELKYSTAFPGKLLFGSFYRYVKEVTENYKNGAFRANYTNDKSFKNSATPFLKFNADCRKVLSPVFSFLTS